MVTTRIRLNNTSTVAVGAAASTINVICPVPQGVLPGQTFTAQWTPGESTMVVINQAMTFQAEVPPANERDPNGTVSIYTPSGQPVDLTLPNTATPGSKITYTVNYDSAGVPHASIVAAPTAQQLSQANAFDKIADFGDEEELATANYHPEGAEMLMNTASAAQKVKVVCPANSFPGSTIQVNAPNGQTLQAVVPAGVFPGQEFIVSLPAPGGAASAPPLDPNALKSGLFVKDAMEMKWDPTAPPAPAGGGFGGGAMNNSSVGGGVSTSMVTLTVTVPPGVAAGGQFLINTPSGQQLTVTCPPGVVSGQQIQVNAPGAAPTVMNVAVDAATKKAMDGGAASAPPMDLGGAGGGSNAPSFL